MESRFRNDKHYKKKRLRLVPNPKRLRTTGGKIMTIGSGQSGSGFRGNVSDSSKWMLFLLASLHLAAALSHFLLSVVSKSIAKDVHYGAQACIPHPKAINSTLEHCSVANDSQICVTLVGDDGSEQCDWDYTGLGLDYQLLAGPSFMAVYTITSIFWGMAADRYDRVNLLALCSLIFSLAMIFTAFATSFWQLVLLRMLLAAGVAGIGPIAPGIIFDSFSERHRALAMGFFHWGIYLGGGLSNAVGKGVTDMHIFPQGWRGAFLVSGVPGIVLGVLMFATGQDPPKMHSRFDKVRSTTRSKGKKIKPLPINIQEELNTETDEDVVIEYEASEAQVLIDNDSEGKTVTYSTMWQCCLEPTVLLLGFGACIRQAAGYTWAYNSALYFQTYYPGFNASWWLTWITIFGGSIGVVFGGFLSDRLVSRLGISARALVLAVSQLLAAPFALGTLWWDPPTAFWSLLVGYLFAEMWYGVVFAILVELLPSSIRSLGMAIALFIINNFGGNVPVLVSPLTSSIGYRGALTLLYPGSLIASSFLFFLSYLALVRK